MKKVHTVADRNKIGYEFTCGCDGAKVGEEVLVCKQYSETPYGTALIIGEIYSDFKMVINEIFE